MKVYRGLYLFATFFCFLFLLASPMLFMGAEDAGIAPSQFESDMASAPLMPPEMHDPKDANPDAESSDSDFRSFSKENGSIYDAINEAIDEVEKNRAG